MTGAQSRRAKAQKTEASAASSSAGSSNSGKSPSPAIDSRFDGNADPMQVPAAPIYDPNAIVSKAVKNLDLGHMSYDLVRGHKVDLCRRPAVASKLGREILMGLNTFPVVLKQGIKVHQYQVMIGNNAEKRGLQMKLWHSKTVQDKLPVPKSWIWDGNTLAWSLQDVPEIRLNVDLDAEAGKPPPPPNSKRQSNTHRVFIKRTNSVDFASLSAYMAGKSDFNNKCLEAVSMMDHLLREYPSQNFSAIKRSFFSKGEKRFELGGGVEAFKGVYQSLRIAHGPAGAQLTVNVDVANGTFFSALPLPAIVTRLLGLRNDTEIALLLKDRGPSGSGLSHKFSELRRLHFLRVWTMHRGAGITDDYVIDRVYSRSATEYKIDIKDKGTGETTKKTIAEYFMDNYKIRLVHPEWPVVQMTKRAILPLELLKVKENQRYQYKLDEKQTAAMIKVAVTAPKDRWEDIEHGLEMVNWAEDPYLRNYGMEISRKQTFVKARLLPNPVVQFDKKPVDPKTSGRWDLKDKKFLEPNTAPLKSWGICAVGSQRLQPSSADVQRFVQQFVAAYKAHGGRVEQTVPCMMQGSELDPGKCVEELFNSTGNKFKMRPQILLFILPGKNSSVYGRIKKSCECRYGVVSQCMQYAHVQKCQPQYISNVLMKFNAKLGGVTSRAVGATSKGPSGVFKVSTCIVGADVSHAAPGSQQHSMAALTVSMNRLATRYAGACETNGYRKEMITQENMKKMLFPLLQHWVQTTGQGSFPKNLIYVRDGVSEGQFSQVVDEEVKYMKDILASVNPNHPTRFIVIIASKRHHVRFFPKAGTGDRNGNALPGTLVETGVTHPFENDFYLCAHSAIKGTARPIHYNVLVNEPGMTNDELQTMIYEHSYQYIRATTPVSLFPAVYYAHLVSNRAMHHDPLFGGTKSEELRKQEEEASQAKALAKAAGKTVPTSVSTDKDRPSPPLMVMPDNTQISKSMWYI